MSFYVPKFFLFDLVFGMYYNGIGDKMKIFCVGNSAYDITTPLDEFPKENTKYRFHEQIECGGGSAGNAAYLLAKWGMNVSFVGVVGKDVYGKRIKDEFKEIGVNIKYLYSSDDYRTISSHIIVNKSNGSRTILSYQANSNEMPDINIKDEIDILFLDGHEYNMSKKLIEQHPSAIVIIDAGRDCKEVKELCKLSDYVVCSKEFMELASGITFDSKSNLETSFEKLESLFNTHIIVTLEDAGCAYRNSLNQVEIIPSIKVKAIDTTGAGDIFHGAFVYGIVKNWPMEKILRFSNVAGAMSVTKMGGRNSIFSLKEIEEAYNEIK